MCLFVYSYKTNILISSVKGNESSISLVMSVIRINPNQRKSLRKGLTIPKILRYLMV
jgi:hypothetical protein